MAKLQIFLPDGTQISHDLQDEKITIGRLADNSLQIDDGSVSSRHAEIDLEAGAYHLHDLESTNGTFVNGERVTDAVLRHGDEVRLGLVETVFHGDEEAPDQPLPASTSVASEAAKISARPAQFVNSSPIPKNVRTKDPLAAGLIAAAVLGILAFAAAAVIIMGMASPA
ncbi:MAG: FHA domain-containing protein [Terrimicrobiaceae bacterium]|jgi:pSer/pThr/pTyr-binding forkhead associated (FHA) protein|nr:FHA domain-containing protein [Terrimicrobiaceae bacterium]